MIIRVSAVIAWCALAAPLLCDAQARPPDSVTLLATVCRYVEDYEQQLSVVIGEEDYRQTVFETSRSIVTKKRRLQSEFALLRLPTDENQWIGVRDVYQVDGRTVPDRTGRLSALLKLPFGAAADQWRALQEESARFNIGDVRRTLNVPTFVLRLLRCDHQPRFVFDEPRVEHESLVVEYREVKRPTVVRDERGEDEPVRGFFHVNPSTGAVTATRLIVGLAKHDVRAQIDVRFTLDAKLRLLVPDEMREEYHVPSGQRVEGVARYQNFKRFEVESSWKVRD
jgi:hypothetical protein